MSYDAFEFRSCETCIMWARIEGKVAGACRRYPPKPRHPATGPGDVCGEHTAAGSGQIRQLGGKS